MNFETPPSVWALLRAQIRNLNDDQPGSSCSYQNCPPSGDIDAIPTSSSRQRGRQTRNRPHYSLQDLFESQCVSIDYLRGLKSRLDAESLRYTTCEHPVPDEDLTKERLAWAARKLSKPLSFALMIIPQLSLKCSSAR